MRWIVFKKMICDCMILEENSNSSIILLYVTAPFAVKISKEAEACLRAAADRYIFDFSDMLEVFLCSETESCISSSALC